MNRRNFLSLAALLFLSLAGWGLQQQTGAVIFPAGWQGTLCIVAEPQVDDFPLRHCLPQSIHEQSDGTVRIEATMPNKAVGFRVYVTTRYGHKSSLTSKDGHVTAVNVVVKKRQ